MYSFSLTIRFCQRGLHSGGVEIHFYWFTFCVQLSGTYNHRRIIILMAPNGAGENQREGLGVRKKRKWVSIYGQTNAVCCSLLQLLAKLFIWKASTVAESGEISKAKQSKSTETRKTVHNKKGKSISAFEIIPKPYKSRESKAEAELRLKPKGAEMNAKKLPLSCAAAAAR